MYQSTLSAFATRVLQRPIWRPSLYRYETTQAASRLLPEVSTPAKPVPPPSTQPPKAPERQARKKREMIIFQDVNHLRKARRYLLSFKRKVGLVPTMGALHEGHLSLVRRALEENADVIVSIFVNPTQFGVNEDLDAYPKTWNEDLAKLQKVEDDFKKSKRGTPQARSRIWGVFAPKVSTMYPILPPTSDIAGYGSFVTITPLGSVLEGASRPVFFRGVATVCMKLFNIVQPEHVYFGQKDIQQSILIKRMVKDFHVPTTVCVVPTEREADGLAMSSRNVYLGDRRREDAAVLSRALFAAKELYDSGVLQTKRLRQAAMKVFDDDLERTRSDGTVGPRGPIEIDYIAMAHPEDMGTIKDNELLHPSSGGILSAAIVVSPVNSPRTQEELNQRSVRLIDNVILEPKVRKARKSDASSDTLTGQPVEKLIGNDGVDGTDLSVGEMFESSSSAPSQPSDTDRTQ